MSKNVRTSTRLARGERLPPPWVATNMAIRPARLCRTEADEQAFKEFVFRELDRRFSAETDALGDEVNAASAVIAEWEVPQPVPRGRGRPKVDVVERQFLPAENAARAVETVREIFEDYWDRWSHKRPSAEEIIADYASWSGWLDPVGLQQVTTRLKRGERRPR